MITYTWGITELVTYPEYDGYPEVVQAVYWTLTGDDGAGHTATMTGAQGVSLELSGSFTPYEDLTEAQVLSWLMESMTPSGVDYYEAEVAKQIEAQANPPAPNPPLPWGAA